MVYDKYVPKTISLTPIALAYKRARERFLLLDYDGTLVPFAPTPEQAKPSSRVLFVIKALSSDNQNTVAIISGRDKDTLDNWLGGLPVRLLAEHGEFEKRNNAWFRTSVVDETWKKTIKPIIELFTQRLPGSLLEEKKTALVFHYRNVSDKTLADKIADELYKRLLPISEKLGLRVTYDNMTIEIRQGNTNKGLAALSGLDNDNFDFVMAAGDGETDEDMFKKLSGQAFCIKIGPGKTAAQFRVESPEAFVDFLSSLAEPGA